MSHRDLDVYKRSYHLAIEIHKLSLKLPRYLQYDLGDQIRRASRSIPSNIAEGMGRAKSVKDKKNFLKDALGSNDEMLFNLEFMRDARLLDEKQFDYHSKEYIICGKQLHNLIVSLPDN